ncbi:MAG: helix-turn-helix domain-containing protein [Solirubrobacteraceae bacterium]|jgi:excisionase family DNA binding protein
MRAGTPLLAAILAELDAADEAVKRELADQLRPFLADDAERLMDVGEKAAQLHLNRDVVARMARDGRIPGAVKVGRRWLFPATATEVLPVDNVGSGRGWLLKPKPLRRAQTAPRASVAAIRGR